MPSGRVLIAAEQLSASFRESWPPSARDTRFKDLHRMDSGHPPDLTSLPLHCQRCGGMVTIHSSDWKKDGKWQPARWTCPHCGRENFAEFPGVLESVTKGH